MSLLEKEGAEIKVIASCYRRYPVHKHFKIK